MPYVLDMYHSPSGEGLHESLKLGKNMEASAKFADASILMRKIGFVVVVLMQKVLFFFSCITYRKSRR